MKIDIDWLTKNSACREGKTWFRTHFPEGGDFDAVLTALAADNERGYAGWLIGVARFVGAFNLRPFVEAAVAYVFKQARMDTVAERAKSAAGAHTTGTGETASATGDQGAASATGDQGAAVALGFQGQAKAAKGGWITVAEWYADKNGWPKERIDVQTVKVDGKNIKAETFYMLKGGKFVEVK